MFLVIKVYSSHVHNEYTAECSGDIKCSCEGISASDALECLLEEVKLEEIKKKEK